MEVDAAGDDGAGGTGSAVSDGGAVSADAEGVEVSADAEGVDRLGLGSSLLDNLLGCIAGTRALGAIPPGFGLEALAMSSAEALAVLLGFGLGGLVLALGGLVVFGLGSPGCSVMKATLALTALAGIKLPLPLLPVCMQMQGQIGRAHV